MAVLSKGCKADGFQSHDSLKLSFTNIQVLCLNFAKCECFLESNSPDILALCENNLDDSIDSGNFSVRDYFPLNQKDSTTHAWSCSSWEGRTSFCTRLTLESSYLCMFSNDFTSLSVLLLFPLSITFLAFMHSF